MKRLTVVLLVVLLVAVAVMGTACTSNPNTAESSSAASPESAEASSESSEAPASASSEESAGEAAGGDQEYFFAMSHFGDANAWNVAQIEDFEQVAAERGYKYTMTNCNGDVNKQLSDIADLLLQEPDALILGPTQSEGLASALKMAKESDVPVFLINRSCDGEAGVDYITLVGCDPKTIGRYEAEVMIDIFGEDAEVRIVELAGTPGATNTIGFAEGFREGIADYPGYEIIVTQVTNFNVAEAQAAMENIVQAQGKDGFDAVFGHCDTDGIAAISVLEDNGMVPGLDPANGEIVITANARTADGLAAVKAGKMAVSVDWEARIADQVYDTILAYFAGETLDTFIEVPVEKITLDNVDQYMDKAF